MNRITWTKDRHNTRRGCVGKLELFTIDPSTTRSGPKYFLRSRMEFLTVDIDMSGDDDEVLKDNAERLLVAYVNALGAVFPEA
ncbi:hypothetical protein [Sphaerisporangium sp. TRM90804]|uniref:hypothetical protein n=1 Tax=Sphaerisporangium sp. TRM90804 TaxID=3031113 RepID=UPI0024498031|nr:hypothetical protein [Sphaerisporangium sp. TRM90804]MDH2424793.1 hypothetical protein [Sphaerisporangium sp. TRM90804]